MKPPPAPLKRLAVACPTTGGKPLKLRRPLPFMIAHKSNPLANVTAPNADIETQSVQIVDETQKAFRAEEKRQLEQLTAMNIDIPPISFFRVLVFNSPEQGQAFAEAVGQAPTQQYMDGRVVCDALNIAIPADTWNPKPSLSKPNKRLQALAMPLPKRG